MPVRRTLPALTLMLFMGMVMLAAGCTTKTSDRDLVYLDATAALEAVRGQRRLVGRSEGVWVDPRTDEEFRSEHIPGAVHLPLERVRENHRMLNNYSVIVVYGNDYNSPRAIAVSKTLMELGHRDVRTLRGGMRAWKDAGQPVESLE